MDLNGNVTMAAKNTTLINADGTNAPVNVNWNSSNVITFNAATIPVTQTANVVISNYTGAFTAFDGTQQDVTDEASLATYNNYLITQVEAGNLDQAGYNAAFAAAIQPATTIPVTYKTGVTDPNDEVTAGQGTNRVIAITGQGSTATVAEGAAITFNASNSTIIDASNGSIVTNNGTLTGANVGINLASGSTGTNNGTINTSATAVQLNGPTTSFINDGSGAQGVINVKNNGTGIILNNGASASNENGAAINVATNAGSFGGTTSGVTINNGSFDNDKESTINIGPGGVIQTNVHEYGIQLKSGTATNEGVITIGTGTQNAVAMASINTAANSSLINSGTININGSNTSLGASLLNVGILAQNNGTTVAENQGIINVAGVNGIGIKVLSSGNTKANADTTSTGVINVSGAADPASGTRNFGVWAEGANATANVDSAVNMTGNGAVGVHARSGATVNLEADASVNFLSGTNQIGYFIYGAGSQILGAADTLDVSTANSTLFRIENGATFSGTSDQTLTASGQNSTIIQGTGMGASVTTGTATLKLTGTGATGVEIDGGATGTISSGTVIQLNADNTVAGQVDGRKFDLNGNISDPTQAGGLNASTLTNNAAIGSGNANVTGFVAQYGGALTNTGSVNLTGTNATGIHALNGGSVNNSGPLTIKTGTGILAENTFSGLTTNVVNSGIMEIASGTGIVDQDGATLNNSSTIHVASGTGVLLQNTTTDNVTQFTNTGAINVDDGIAGVEVRAGASLNGDALAGTITTKGTAHGVLVGTGAAGASLGAVTIDVKGTGNGLENQAELAGIGFTDTTIDMDGSGAGIRTGASTATNSTVTVNAKGTNSTGYLFQLASGTKTDKNLNIGSGYTFNVSGNGAIGVRVNTSGNAEVDSVVNATGVNTTGIVVDSADTASLGANVTVSGAGATGIRINSATNSIVSGNVSVTNAASGSALVVATANPVTNTGSLTSVSAAPVVDLSPSNGANFTNTNIITSALVGGVPTNIAIKGSAGADTVNLESLKDNDGNVISSSAVTGIIQMGDGSDTVNWYAGTLNGSIEMGGGADVLTINKTASDLANVYHLDGGGQGGDTLNLDNVNYRGGTFGAMGTSDDLAKGTNLTNWDTINFNNTTWELTDDLTLVGSAVNIDATSVLKAGNGVDPTVGDANLNTLVTNSGLITLQNGNSGNTDRLTIAGSYAGVAGSQVALNTYLGLDNSPTDLLEVNRNTSGTSGLSILRDPASVGAQTRADGIRVVQVDTGAAGSNGTFTAPRMIAGAYEYDLFKNGVGADSNDGNWYLRSSVTPAAQTSNVLPNSLLQFAGLSVGTLQERTGNRLWSGGEPVTAKIWCKDASKNFQCEVTPEQDSVYADSKGTKVFVMGSGVWSRIVGQWGTQKATEGTGYDHNEWIAQTGIDGALAETSYGDLVAGVMALYGHQNVDVNVSRDPISGAARSGHISSDAYGAGANLTWIGNNGIYVDAVGQYVWYNSDINSSDVGSLANGNNGRSYALSLEAGKRFTLGDGWTVVPQAQLIYSNADFDGYSYSQTDGQAVTSTVGVKNAGSDSLRGRAGVRIEKLADWASSGGTRYRLQTYGLANVYDEFLNGTSVQVGNSPTLTESGQRLWGEAGLGATLAVADKVSLYAEGRYATALSESNTDGRSNAYGGNLGLRIGW